MLPSPLITTDHHWLHAHRPNGTGFHKERRERIADLSSDGAIRSCTQPQFYSLKFPYINNGYNSGSPGKSA
jgi:hypothetical protein